MRLPVFLQSIAPSRPQTRAVEVRLQASAARGKSSDKAGAAAALVPGAHAAKCWFFGLLACRQRGCTWGGTGVGS